MSASEPAAPAPRVAAVVVVRDGGAWLPAVLDALAGLRYPALDVVAVDGGSTDGSPELLASRLPSQRVVTLPRDVGFGRAVAAALAQVEEVAAADYILLVHDDLVLAPRALARMVRAMVGDASLGIVGPKLRDWSQERTLQEVGMTIDRLGRAESGLDPGELDQGQHDGQREVLYVSTAGMLLRREVLREVGGFDPRFPAFRDDLDLCWRAWLAGLRVEVVPRAVGYHMAAASRRARPVGGGRAWDARFMAERHTLATLLKNYGALRLAWILPVVVAVGLAKVFAFTVTRRFGDALATAAAWAWNAGQLPRTLRRRHQAQARRQVSDGELDRLFAPGLPRLRSYGEALGSWLAGGSTRALIDEQDVSRRTVDDLSGLRSFVHALRERPGLSVGVLLLAAYLIGLAPLLGPGQLVGGEVAGWPASPVDFLAAYAHPWNGEPLATHGFASPVQALLGLVSFAGLGSAWFAQRLAVLGLLPLAWLLALRAGRLVTLRKGPRALGATLYALSPVLVGALAHGRFGMLVVAALLPGLVLLGVRAADGEAPVPGAWRATAMLALGLAVAGAADVSLLPLVGALYVALLAAAALRPAGRGAALARLGGAGVVALLLLAPWLARLARAGWETLLAPVEQSLPLWRALGLVPEVVPGMTVVGAGVSVALGLAVLTGALLVSLRARPGAVAGLLAVWVASALAAWGVATTAAAAVWPPALLLPGALAQAGLGVLAARWLAGGLRTYAFGVRQLAIAGVAVVLGLGLAAGVVRLGTGPWDGLRRDPELLPAFVTAEVPRVGPYRILLLSQDARAAGGVRWDVVDATGPDMRTYGTVADDDLVEHLGTAVAAVAGGTDPTGGATLGLANVRYVVAPEAGATERLVAAVGRQPALDPVPAGETRVWRVRTWVPRASVLPAAAVAEADVGEMLVDADLLPLARTGTARYAGAVPGRRGGLLLLAEAEDGAWTATGDGRPLRRGQATAVNAFEVPEDVGRVVVELPATPLHGIVVGLQALLALGALSVALRPPRGTQRRDGAPAALPEELDAEDDTEDLPVPAALGAPAPDTAEADPSPPEPPAGEERP